nr:MAG TPA: protein of unknown function (DUF5351) [Caudoviricetes sp.]
METRRVRRKCKDENEYEYSYPPFFEYEPEFMIEDIRPGCTCHYCFGTGHFVLKDGIKTGFRECPLCKGSGKVDVIITIEYKPSEIQNNEQDKTNT